MMGSTKGNDNLAEIYSKYNKIQREYGIKLVGLLGVKSGEKVLDMGCGTGEITAFIAEKVGEEEEVDGVDPDKERIQFAVQKYHRKERNINFIVGDSSSHFLLLKQSYYDVHFSNFVFQWLSAQEKEMFVKTAWRCLKPGGSIGWYCQEGLSEVCGALSHLFPNAAKKQEFAEKSTTEAMLKHVGFLIESSEYNLDKQEFSSLDDLLTWFCVSDYYDKTKISPAKKESFAKKYVCGAGTVYSETLIYRIIAKKPIGI